MKKPKNITPEQWSAIQARWRRLAESYANEHDDGTRGGWQEAYNKALKFYRQRWEGKNPPKI